MQQIFVQTATSKQKHPHLPHTGEACFFFPSGGMRSAVVSCSYQELRTSNMAGGGRVCTAAAAKCDSAPAAGPLAAWRTMLSTSCVELTLGFKPTIRSTHPCVRKYTSLTVCSAHTAWYGQVETNEGARGAARKRLRSDG